jgi:hypothetical protein
MIKMKLKKLQEVMNSFGEPVAAHVVSAAQQPDS